MACGRNLVNALVVVGAVAWSGCAGRTEDSSADDPGAESEAELTAGAASLKGRWRSTETTYLQKVRFDRNGTFIADVNLERLDEACSQASPDCTTITAGKFKTRRGNKLILEVPKIVEVTRHAKTLAFHYELSADRRELVIDGDAGRQSFEYYAGCEDDLHCRDGLVCVEKPDWGGARCGRAVVPVPHN